MENEANDLKVSLRILLGKSTSSTTAFGHFFTFTFPEYIWETLVTISSLETLRLISCVGSDYPQYSYVG
jgi:hypothetical protein